MNTLPSRPSGCYDGDREFEYSFDANAEYAYDQFEKTKSGDAVPMGEEETSVPCDPKPNTEVLLGAVSNEVETMTETCAPSGYNMLQKYKSKKLSQPWQSI